MSQAVQCSQCPDQLFPVPGIRESEPEILSEKFKKKLLGELLWPTFRLLTGKDIGSLNALQDLLHGTLNRIDQEEGIKIDIDTFREAIIILLSLPNDIPMPELDLEETGDIVMEWYYDKFNVFSLIVDGGGTIYYAGLFGSIDDRDSGRKPFKYIRDERIIELIRRIVY